MKLKDNLQMYRCCRAFPKVLSATLLGLFLNINGIHHTITLASYLDDCNTRGPMEKER